ncbi:hypothetical protein KCU67_g13119, partial [Aureobasidium melanogenum]
MTGLNSTSSLASTPPKNESLPNLAVARWLDTKPETEELKAARAAAYIPKTMDELHNQYLNFQVLPAPKDTAFVEAQPKAVAIDTVQWWTEFVRTQPLEGQKQFGHRKDRTEVLEGEAAEHDCKEMEGAD